ncbi:MAG TPA: LysR family transcriptional regulator [Solirubrobacteraceae bacterium]|nr:LysR family transcriptional regulator [Solirubrobacteraceae bacterium]
MLNVNRLRTLSEVARRGSFSAAADALDYTQSAVSQQIATLEAETGTTLLERHGRTVHLTAAGQTLVAHADGILARLEAAEAALGAIAGLRGGRLRMASFPSAGGAIMPTAIAAFRAAHPLVELSLAEGEPEQVAPRLRAGELDLALLFEFADGPALAEGMERTVLLEDPLHVALPAGHRLAGAPSVDIADLAGEAWVQTALRSPCALQVLRSCHAAGFEPHVAFESDDYQTVQGLVAAGVGVALIPALALSPQNKGVIIRPLSPAPPKRTVFAATPPAARLVPAAPAMVEFIAAVAARRAA